MSKQRTELVVRRNTAVAAKGVVTIPCTSLTDQQVPEGSYLCSFDVSDPVNEALIFKADDNATLDVMECMAKPFNLVHWACKKIMMAATEELPQRPAVRTTLFDDKGETLAFVSGGILLSLDLIRTLRGDGPYDPPYKILVKAAKTNAGFRVYKLFPAEPGLLV